MKLAKVPVKHAAWSCRPSSRKKGIQKFLLFFTILLSPLGLCSQHSMTNGELRTFSPNFRLYPGTMNQTEVFIVRSPLDEMVLFSSCNTLNFIPFFISEGIFTSFDGGLTWQGSDTLPVTCTSWRGPRYYTTQRYILLTRLGMNFVGCFHIIRPQVGLRPKGHFDVTWVPFRLRQRSRFTVLWSYLCRLGEVCTSIPADDGLYR